MPYLDGPEHGMSILANVEGDGVIIGIELGDGMHRVSLVVDGDHLLRAGKINGDHGIITDASPDIADIGAHTIALRIGVGLLEMVDGTDDGEHGGENGSRETPARSHAEPPPREKMSVRFSDGCINAAGSGRGWGGHGRAALRAGGLLAGGGIGRGDGRLAVGAGKAQSHGYLLHMMRDTSRDV